MFIETGDLQMGDFYKARLGPTSSTPCGLAVARGEILTLKLSDI